MEDSPAKHNSKKREGETKSRKLRHSENYWKIIAHHSQPSRWSRRRVNKSLLPSYSLATNSEHRRPSGTTFCPPPLPPPCACHRQRNKRVKRGQRRVNNLKMCCLMVDSWLDACNHKFIEQHEFVSMLRQ